MQENCVRTDEREIEIDRERERERERGVYVCASMRPRLCDVTRCVDEDGKCSDDDDDEGRQ